MPASAISTTAWLMAVRDRINELAREHIDDLHPMGQGYFLENLSQARDAWYRGDLISLAAATRLAEERLVKERSYLHGKPQADHALG
jgi:hypothetical protein